MTELAPTSDEAGSDSAFCCCDWLELAPVTRDPLSDSVIPKGKKKQVFTGNVKMKLVVELLL